MTTKLGSLKKVELRNYWKHEALDFTRWLALDENINLLNEELGLSLIEVRAEESIGKFNVDLVAKDEFSGAKVIIENQLEQTDHKHLGQILTYASGFDASIIIWIVKDAREEHQKAMEWLNSNTSSDLSFFLIRMELWQIGESPYAPKFHILTQPNNWAKVLKENSSSNTELTDTKLAQLQFWEDFIEFSSDKSTSIRLSRKPRAQHWYDISFGSSNAHINYTINTRENLVTTSIYIPNSTELYFTFFENKDKIENELGFQLEWNQLEGRMASRITISKDADINDESSWSSYYDWLLEKSDKMATVFGEFI